ncbi:hypothetical protein HDU67_009912 [Dinochytrium kinnereticum]|nr:hypothetical protein HDU67_009912 [Dinochytrium kinnereticum]
MTPSLATTSTATPSFADSGQRLAIDSAGDVDGRGRERAEARCREGGFSQSSVKTPLMAQPGKDLVVGGTVASLDDFMATEESSLSLKQHAFSPLDNISKNTWVVDSEVEQVYRTVLHDGRRDHNLNAIESTDSKPILSDFESLHNDQLLNMDGEPWDTTPSSDLTTIPNPPNSLKPQEATPESDLIKIIFPLHVQREAATGKVKDLTFPVLSFSEENATKGVDSWMPVITAKEIESIQTVPEEKDTEMGKVSVKKCSEKRNILKTAQLGKMGRSAFRRKVDRDPSLMEERSIANGGQTGGEEKTGDGEQRLQRPKTVLWTHDLVNMDTDNKEVIASKQNSASDKVEISLDKSLYSSRRKSAKRSDSSFNRFALKIRVSSAFKRIPSAGSQNRPRTSFLTNALVATTSIGVEAHMRRAAISGRLVKSEPSLATVRDDQQVAGVMSSLSHVLSDKELESGQLRMQHLKTTARLSVEGEKMSKAPKPETRFSDKKSMLLMPLRKGGATYGSSAVSSRPEAGSVILNAETYNKADLDDVVDWEDTSSTASGTSSDNARGSIENADDDPIMTIEMSEEVVREGHLKAEREKDDAHIKISVSAPTSAKAIELLTPLQRVKGNVNKRRLSIPEIFTVEMAYVSEETFAIKNPISSARSSKVKDRTSSLIDSEHQSQVVQKEPQSSYQSVTSLQLWPIKDTVASKSTLSSGTAKRLSQTRSSQPTDLAFKPELNVKAMEKGEQSEPRLLAIVDIERSSAQAPHPKKTDGKKSDLEPSLLQLLPERKKSLQHAQNNRALSVSNIQLPVIYARHQNHLPRIKPYSSMEDNTFSALRDNFTPGKPIPKPFNIPPNKLSIVQPRHHPKLFMTLRPLSGVKREMVTFAGSQPVLDIFESSLEKIRDGFCIDKERLEARPPYDTPKDLSPLVSDATQTIAQADTNPSEDHPESMLSVRPLESPIHRRAPSPAAVSQVLSPTPWLQ